MRSLQRCTRLASVVAVFAAAACAPIFSRTPVNGERATVQRLAGEWEGTYSSQETGRSGTITFRLRAGADTAEGDVMMLPAAVAETPAVEGSSIPPLATAYRSELLTIRFVLASRDEIEGSLDAYRDPSCGCTLTTRFRGLLTGDVIEGTYTSDGNGISHVPTSGRWRVTRVTRSK